MTHYQLELEIKKLKQILCCIKPTLYFDNSTLFPLTGEVNTLYIDENSFQLYIWDGTAYKTYLPTGDNWGTQVIEHTDTPSINLEGTGTTILPLTADVILSADAGNTIEERISGLYVPTPSPFLLNTLDTPTVNLSGDGTVGTPLSADVILSANSYQAITEQVDGLWSPQFYIEVTKTELDALIGTSSLIEGATYKITGLDSILYGGTTGYFKAIEVNKIDEAGTGTFYNPKYDIYPIWERYSTITITLQSGIFTLGGTITANNGATATIHDDARGLIIPLTGDWTTATSITGGAITATVSGFVLNPGYLAGTKVIWGGKVWINQTGSIGTSTSVYGLDLVNWTEAAYNTTDYTLVYDEIKYDYANNLIIYRKDNKNNIVSTSKVSNDIIDATYASASANPIIGFQWGNNAVIGNKIFDSYFEIINQKGTQVYENTLESNSALFNGYFNTTSTFNYNKFKRSYITTLSLNTVDYINNTFDNACYSTGCCFFNMDVKSNIFTNESYWTNDRIYGANFEKNIFEGNSSCTNNFRNCHIKQNNFRNESYINGNAFTGFYDYGYSTSGIASNDVASGGFYQNRQFTGYPASVFKNIIIDSNISSNTLNEGGSTSYNTLSHGGIYGNNLSPIGGSYAGLIDYNFCHFSSIDYNVGQIEVYRNSLSSYSAITNNTTQGNGFIQINHNTLTSEGGITSCKVLTGFNCSIRYNSIKTASIAYIDFNGSFFIRQNIIEDEVFNDRVPTRISVTEEVSDCLINSNEMTLYIKKNLTGAAGAGAVGALSIQTYVIPTNFFIEEVWIDFRSGIGYGAGATINLGLETDGLTDGLDNTSGDLATINNNITKIVKTSFLPAAGNRLLVMSVQNAALTSGTIYIRIKLRNLKRITFP